MSLYIASINSGSNGNCYYVGNDHEAVLVDVGLTCRETEKRMRRMELSMDKVKAIFISHEHGDHIKGLEVIAHKYQLPVYITEPTLRHSRLQLDKALLRSFKAYEPVAIGALSVHPFLKFHDAADPHSFVIEGNNVRIGVFTDIGTPCTHLERHFARCHAAFLESNYDEQMLESGRYPFHLRRRISGDHGHLSNRQAAEMFLKHKPAYMSRVLLSHLSKDNNTPEAALAAFLPYAGHTRVEVASRYNESPVYHITAPGPAVAIPVRKPKTAQRMVQASLF